MASTLGAFAFRRRLTIDTTAAGGNIASSLTSFPVCVAVNATSWGTVQAGHFFNSTNTSGKRVQFFASSGTNLPYEVQKYDSTGSDAVYWVAVTVAGNSTTTIDVGYGSDPNGADQNSSPWPSILVAGYHLDASGTAVSGTDFSATGNTATMQSGPGTATGIVAEAGTFNGSTQYASLASIPVIGSYPSYSCWIKLSAYTSDAWMVSLGNTSSNGFHLGTYGGGFQNTFATQAGGGQNVAYSTTAPLTNGTAWYHVAAEQDGTNTSIYVNGVRQRQVANTVLNTPTTNATLMRRGQGTFFMNGTLDEVRIYANAASTAMRGADWFKAEYVSMATNSTVQAYTRGSASPNGWTNPNNATADDGIYATAAPSAGATISGLWDFAAFSIPSDATIVSIAGEIAWFQSGSTLTGAIQGYKAGVAQGSKVTTTVPAGKGYYSIDLSTIFSLSDLTTAGGAQLYVEVTRSGGGSTASLDAVQLIVTYSRPSSFVGSTWLSVGAERVLPRTTVVRQSLTRASSW